MATYDAIVVGLGAMGSAVTCQLASRGVSVLGLDAHDPPHSMGSSSGDTRITRLAVGEGAAYAPLVARSHELWRELEDEARSLLMVQCGGLIMASATSTGQHGVAGFVDATRDVAAQFGIDHEVLDAGEIRSRFGFCVTDEVGVYEPSAGYLLAGSCVAAQLRLARRHGATVRTDDPVTSWRTTASGVEVTTATATYEAGTVVLCVGAWVAGLVPALAGVVAVERQVQHWFDVEARYLEASSLPVFIWLHGPGPDELMYGVPARDGRFGGMKVATERFGAPVSLEAVDRGVAGREAASMYADHVAGRLPWMTPACVRSVVCLYTVAPGFRFVIDTVDDHGRALVVSACSGHGFKHSAAIGEAVAQRIVGDDQRVDLDAFGLSQVAGAHARGAADVGGRGGT